MTTASPRTPDRDLVVTIADLAMKALFRGEFAPVAGIFAAALVAAYDGNQKKWSGRPPDKGVRRSLNLPESATDEQVVDEGWRRIYRGVQRVWRTGGDGGMGQGFPELLAGLWTSESYPRSLFPKNTDTTKSCTFDAEGMKKTWAKALSMPASPDLLSNRFFGSNVHRHLQGLYILEHLTDVMVIERTIFDITEQEDVYVPGAVPETLRRHQVKPPAKPSTPFQVLEKILTSMKDSALRADLIDLSTNEAWEIKARASVVDAVHQIAYLTQAYNCWAIGPPLKPGSLWHEEQTTPYQEVVNGELWVAKPHMSPFEWPGLVLYDVSKVPVPDPKVVPLLKDLLDLVKETLRKKQQEEKGKGKAPTPVPPVPVPVGEGGFADANEPQPFLTPKRVVLTLLGAVIIVGIGVLTLGAADAVLFAMGAASAAAVLMVPTSAEAAIPRPASGVQPPSAPTPPGGTLIYAGVTYHYVPDAVALSKVLDEMTAQALRDGIRSMFEDLKK